MDVIGKEQLASLSFRPASDADAAVLHRIYSDPMTAPHMGFDPCDLEALRSLLAAMCRDETLMVCETLGRVVGVYRLELLGHRLSHVARIGAVAVTAEAIGTGLAGAMVEHAIGQAAERGATRVELTVAADNARGIAFWRKLGFEVEGRFREYFSRHGKPGLFDELAMALILNKRRSVREHGLTSKKTAPHYEWGQGCDGWRLADSDTLSVIEERMPAGASEVRHRHAAACQVFYTLSGELRFEIDGDDLLAKSGDAVRIPAGVPHRVWTADDGPGATFLVISQPTTRGDCDSV